MKAFGINRDVFDRLQSSLGYIESYNHQLTPYDGVIGDMSKWWDGQVCRGFSPTSLETFGMCPFKFFMGKILELESLEEPETAEMIAAVDLGTLYHNILRDFYHTLIENNYFNVKGYKLNSVAQNGRDQKTPPSSPCEGGDKAPDGRKTFFSGNPIELLQSIAQRYFTKIEQQIPIPYPVIWEIEKEEILALLTRFVTWDIEHIEQTGYVPTYLEKTVKLGPQNDFYKLIPEYFKQEDTSGITFKGKIDRIDIKQDEDTASFRVIDYKSGKFSRENLVRSAIRGQKLQLPFYIIMTEHFLSEAIKKGRISKDQVRLDEASFVYVGEDMEEKNGQISPPKKTIDSNDWMACKEQYWETLREFLHIIRKGIFPISSAEDTQRCEWCEFATTCRRSHQPLRFRLERDVRLKKYREIMNLNISKKSSKP
jgi:RecB family exonuclease